MSSSLTSATLQLHALVLSRVAYGEADFIIGAYTNHLGKISALARGARKSQKRFLGSLEPMHTLVFEVSAVPKGELHTLKGAQIQKPRLNLLENLEAMTGAGRALSWVKRASSPHEQDPSLWLALNQTLDELNDCEPSFADDILAGFGLRLLEIQGWGINLSSCVACGKSCPSGRAAWMNPERGGLLCRACGGGPFQITGSERHSLSRVALGLDQRPSHDAVPLTLKVVERALGAHLGWDDGGGIKDLGQRRK